MNKKTLGVILVVVGAVMLLVALGADVVGLGGSPAFGYKQITGTAVGALVAVVGVVMLVRR